ncbi:hypothetical protein F3J14_15420 [Burkholderia sp. Tr-862]|nr:hypothetical protein [Burkholderia sp. Tr-862]
MQRLRRSPTCDTHAFAMSDAGPCSRKRIAITRRSLATDCRETRRFPAFHRFSPAVRLPAPWWSRMVLTVRARLSPDLRPSSRTTAARAVPAVTVSAAPSFGAARS